MKKTTPTPEKRSIVNLTDEEIKANLNSWFASSTDEQIEGGRHWYRAAQVFCKHIATKYGLEPYLVASVVSVLSPRNQWERNKFDAEACIKAWKQGKDASSLKVCTFNANKLKAFRILTEGAEIAASSPKTHAFAMNVGLLSNEHITIDSWHVRACLCNPTEGVVPTVDSITAKQYRRIEALTSECAEGLTGYRYQAIVWVTIKQAWGR